MIVGVVGPFLAAFFLQKGLEKENLIATKATCQLSVQIVKTIFFATLLNVNYGEHLQFLTVVSLSFIVATFVSKKILKVIPLKVFRALVKILLICLTGKLLYSGVSNLLSAIS